MSELIETETGASPQPLRVVAQDGRALAPEDMSLRITVK